MARNGLAKDLWLCLRAISPDVAQMEKGQDRPAGSIDLGNNVPPVPLVRWHAV